LTIETVSLVPLEPKVEVVTINPTTTTTIFLAGDSTVCDYPSMSDPSISYGGWGQMLPAYVKPGVKVVNYAGTGRSAISFINEGRLDAISNAIKPDDYLFIQFGHNDSHEGSGSFPFTTYTSALQKYIDVAREHRATPILVTPVARRRFDENDQIVDTHDDYPVAMRQLAAAEHVDLIDLTLLSMTYFQSLGPIDTQSIFLFLDPGQSPEHPDGVADNTHFRVSGAKQIAELVINAIKAQDLQPLASYLT
jgi:lysophospholipase L1-like esterase